MRTEKAFELLELDVTASSEEIKEAYKTKVRQLHPDKIGAGTDDAEWKTINDRFSLIQEAYRTLTNSNALGDKAYRIRKLRRQQERRLKQASLRVFEIDEVPDQLIEQLNKRMNSEQRDQLFIPKESLTSYLTILFISVAFFAFLPFMIGYPDTVMDWMILVIALSVILLEMGYIWHKWKRHVDAPLKPGVWILPTDVIMVDYDEVAIAPLLSLRRWSVNPAQTVYGMEGDVNLKFRFYNSSMTLTVDSMSKANQIEFAVRYWQKLWKGSDDLMGYYRENSLVAELIFKRDGVNSF